MNGNPDEVVTLLLTNGDAIPVQQFDAVFQSTGLSQYVFRPNGVLSKDQWPTLQELLDAKTRLVVFMGKRRVFIPPYLPVCQGEDMCE
jgi:hypothetical protein